MTSKPLEVFAYIFWAIGAAALVGGVLLFFRAGSDADGRRRAGAPVALITFAALMLLFGTSAFFAKSGGLADPDSARYSGASDDLTTTLSPIPTALSAPAQASPTIEPDSGEEAPPVEIGFEEIGSVAVGGSKSKIEASYGKPAAVVETVADDGKPVEAYSFEGKRQFMIHVRDSKVRSYTVLSPGFVTFSGVAIGDTYDKVDNTYGSKLKAISDNVYALSGPQSTSMRFHFENGKVSRIEGGQLG